MSVLRICYLVDRLENELAQTDNHLHGINEMVDKLRKWRSLMEDIRKEQIQDELFVMKKTLAKNSRGSSFTTKVGDLVIYQLKGKHNMSRFGRMT